MLTASQLVLAFGLVSSVSAQGGGFVPLAQKKFDWGNIVRASTLVEDALLTASVALQSRH
jgi:hypothetical protein